MTHLLKAYRYARSRKTLLELEKVYERLNSALVSSNAYIIARSTSSSQVSGQSRNDSASISQSIEVEVCPEVWGGPKIEDHFHEEGFVMNCIGYSPKPFGSVLTLLFNFVDEADIADFYQIAKERFNITSLLFSAMWTRNVRISCRFWQEILGLYMAKVMQEGIFPA